MSDAEGGFVIRGTPLNHSVLDYMEVIRFLTVPEDLHDTPTFATGKSVDILELDDPHRRQIVNCMLASTTRRSYGSLEAAAKKVDFRHQLILEMASLQGEADARPFVPGDTAPQLGSASTTEDAAAPGPWRLVDPSDARIAAWQPAPDTTSAELFAEEALLPFRGDSAGAFQWCAFRALLASGGELSDLEAVRIGPWDGAIQECLSFGDLAELDPLPGDYVYFQNKFDYPMHAPAGACMGLSLMVMGVDNEGTRRYSGLGIDWMSEANIRAELVSAYERDCSPNVVSDPEAELGITQVATVHTPKAASARPRRDPIEPGSDDAELVTIEVAALTHRFDRAALRPMTSAPALGGPHIAETATGHLVIERINPAADIHDPATLVSVHPSA